MHIVLLRKADLDTVLWISVVQVRSRDVGAAEQDAFGLAGWSSIERCPGPQARSNRCERVASEYIGHCHHGRAISHLDGTRIPLSGQSKDAVAVRVSDESSC